MKPFKHEIKDPIYLKCGVTIWENNSTVTKKHLNDLCNLANKNFKPFVSKFFKVKHNKSFHWDVSLLKPGSYYRCMNDLNYRFFERSQVLMKGYTSFNKRWTFIDGTDDVEFDVTFVHEMFHAMSIFYGTWSSRDEELAQKFTEFLGLGR
jgi:hypothetical protein